MRERTTMNLDRELVRVHYFEVPTAAAVSYSRM